MLSRFDVCVLLLMPRFSLFNTIFVRFFLYHFAFLIHKTNKSNFPVFQFWWHKTRFTTTLLSLRIFDSFATFCFLFIFYSHRKFTKKHCAIEATFLFELFLFCLLSSISFLKNENCQDQSTKNIIKMNNNNKIACVHNTVNKLFFFLSLTYIPSFLMVF